MTTTPTTARARLEPLVRAVAWLALLAAGHVGLMAAGSTLPTPPAPWHPDELLDWAQQGEVAETSFAVLRVLGLAVVWYLAAITVLTLLARLSGLRPLAFVAHRLAIPSVRRLVNHMLGAGLALTLAGGVVPMAGAGMASAATAPAATSTYEAPPGQRIATMEVLDDGEPGIARMTELPDDGPLTAEAGGVSVLPIGRSLARATASMHLLEEPAAPATWTIAPGDHLWHVAAATLESTWGRAPSVQEVASYWTTLIEHNRSRLAVPDDPDLVYPGQVFELPPVPGTGP